MKTFTATKTIELLYTIEAQSSEEALQIASELGDEHAFQSTILEVIDESNEEYEASIKE